MKILVLLGPLTLYWHGLEGLKKLGHEVVTYDMIEKDGGVAIIDAVDAERPDLVVIDGQFPSRLKTIGCALTERGIKCVPVLLEHDLKKRRRRQGDGTIMEVNRPIIDMLIDVFGQNGSGGLDAFDKRGEISDLQAVLERISLINK